MHRCHKHKLPNTCSTVHPWTAHKMQKWLSHKGKWWCCYGDYNGMFKILYETGYLCNLATTAGYIFGSLNNFVHKLFFHDRTILQSALRIMNAIQPYQILQSWGSCWLTHITTHYICIFGLRRIPFKWDLVYHLDMVHVGMTDPFECKHY